MTFRLIIKLLQRFRGDAALIATAVNAEGLAAAGNRNIESGLDMLEVRVERPAQIGEAFVVYWRKREFDRFQAGSLIRTSPRNECGSASVIRTSIMWP